MKKVSFVIGVALAMVLSGCSGKPEVGDVKGVIIEAWSPCKLVKVTDVKKTNGIDRGNFYQMAVSYKLELLQDVSDEDDWRPSMPADTPSEIILRKRGFLSANCPGPIINNGYALAQAFAETIGSPLKKGVAVERVSEFSMVKSEQGWVVQ